MQENQAKLMQTARKMSLLTLGLHYETAPIELREKLSFIATQISEGLQEVQHLGGISEDHVVGLFESVRNLFSSSSTYPRSLSVLSVMDTLLRLIPRRFATSVTRAYPFSPNNAEIAII